MADKQAKIQGIEDIIEHTFQDRELLWEALQAPGSNELYPTGNRTMAVVGDTVLKLVLLEDLKATGATPGTMFRRKTEMLADITDCLLGIISNAVSRIGSNSNLDQCGRMNGLEHFINKNPSQGNNVSPVTMTATVEAILAAVYYDSGRTTDNVRTVMDTLGLWPEVNKGI